MKKLSVLLIFIFINNTTVYSQIFDTLNFIDNFSQYVLFLNSTKTTKVCNAFKNSKYFAYKINRVFSKGYPEYAMNEDYYKKHKISEVAFITYCEVDSERNYLSDFVFYSPVKNTSYISNKLLNDDWVKEKFPNDLMYSFSKIINNENYRIDNEKYPNRDTIRYSLNITNETEKDESRQRQLIEQMIKTNSINHINDSIANLIPLDTIKGIYYAKTEYDKPKNYTGL